MKSPCFNAIDVLQHVSAGYRGGRFNQIRLVPIAIGAGGF